MKHFMYSFAAALLSCTPVFGQVSLEEIVPAPKIAVKTNLLYDATSTFNLGFEFGLGKKWTLDVSGNYNPWTFSENRKMKHWLIQPEIRWWICRRFSGHFLGLHSHYAQYNMGGMLPWGFNSGKMFGSIENPNILRTATKAGLPEPVSVTVTIGFSATVGAWKLLSV